MKQIVLFFMHFCPVSNHGEKYFSFKIARFVFVQYICYHEKYWSTLRETFTVDHSKDERTVGRVHDLFKSQTLIACFLCQSHTGPFPRSPLVLFTSFCPLLASYENMYAIFFSRCVGDGKKILKSLESWDQLDKRKISFIIDALIDTYLLGWSETRLSLVKTLIAWERQRFIFSQNIGTISKK